ncbi:PIN domain-containing protein [Candidatus Woesearchaeota archaeon]|nr:PIN domain-containing protein [Candidatus Woesearchaeota archaeon]
MKGKYVVDSSAWIEYLRGTEKGPQVRVLFEKGHEFFTTGVCVAEIIAKFRKEGFLNPSLLMLSGHIQR